MSAPLILGIDVGQAGAAALLDQHGALLDLADLPVLSDGPACRPSISAPLLAGIIRRWQPGAAYIEHVGPMPHDGAKQAFAFGAARAVEAVLLVLGVPVTWLTVPRWKRLVGIPAGRDQKDTARAVAVRRWPAHAERFARAKDDGRAEACLIALAGLQLEAARLLPTSAGVVS